MSVRRTPAGARSWVVVDVGPDPYEPWPEEVFGPFDTEAGAEEFAKATNAPAAAAGRTARTVVVELSPPY